MTNLTIIQQIQCWFEVIFFAKILSEMEEASPPKLLILMTLLALLTRLTMVTMHNAPAVN